MFNNFNNSELEDNRNFIQPGGDAAFGCSFTYGYSIEHKDSWPALLDLYNCGQNGSSNDRITRHAIEYINTYHPENIYIMWTIKSRREWIDEDSNILRFKIDDSTMEYKWQEAHLELSNTEIDNYNYRKNNLLLNSFCVFNNVRLHQLDIHSIDHTTMPLGSDNSHPGVEWHAIIADHFKSLVEKS